MDLTKYKPSQNHTELETLLEILSVRKIKTVVEIGVDKGYSLEVWHDFLKPEVLIGIDPNEAGVDPEALKNSGATFLPGLSQSPDIFDKVKSLTNGNIDFLFIDGDHHYQAVKDDFNKYMPLVSHGVVVFHDAGLQNHPDVEVTKFWTEIKDRYNNTIFIHFDGTGYGVIYK